MNPVYYCHTGFMFLNTGTIVPVLYLLLERSFRLKLMNTLKHE